MKEINKVIEKNKDLSTELMQNYIKSLEDEKFKSLLSIVKIDEEVAKKYTSRIMDSAIEFDHCKNCKGLSECKNSLKGFCIIPKQNNKRIDFIYKACNYSKKEEYKDNLTIFDVPSAIKNASIKDIYKNDKNRLAILKEIKEYLSNYENATKGIYLHGSFGSGKTYLIAALFNELAKKNIKSVIIHTPELFRSLKDSFSSNYSEKFDMLKKVPLLLLDDIGAEYLTSWSRDEVLEPILQYRMDEKLPTFFTSNFTLDELENHLSITNGGVDKLKAKRIIERIKQVSIDVELISKNLRQ